MPPFSLTGAAFRSVAVSFVPELGSADERVWATVERTIDSALGARHSALGEQVRMFIKVIDLLARLRFGRGVHRLEPGQVGRLMGALERAPFRLIRRGVWGLRTLVLMAYYTQPEVVASLGYRADRAGWAARR